MTGLEQGQTYTLYLAAGNAVGFGDVAKFRVRTQRETPAEQAGECSRVTSGWQEFSTNIAP